MMPIYLTQNLSYLVNSYPIIPQPNISTTWESPYNYQHFHNFYQCPPTGST